MVNVILTEHYGCSGHIPCHQLLWNAALGKYRVKGCMQIPPSHVLGSDA